MKCNKEGWNQKLWGLNTIENEHFKWILIPLNLWHIYTSTSNDIKEKWSGPKTVRDGGNCGAGHTAKCGAVEDITGGHFKAKRSQKL